MTVALLVAAFALATVTLVRAQSASPTLSPPYAPPSVVRFRVTIGWPADRTPSAPAGFRVVHGRPCGLALVADDAGDTIWRVAYTGT